MIDIARPESHCDPKAFLLFNKQETVISLHSYTTPVKPSSAGALLTARDTPTGKRETKNHNCNSEYLIMQDNKANATLSVRI